MLLDKAQKYVQMLLAITLRFLCMCVCMFVSVSEADFIQFLIHISCVSLYCAGVCGYRDSFGTESPEGVE